MKFLLMAFMTVFSFVSFAQTAKVDIQLFPAGSFEAKGKVLGHLSRKGGKLGGTFKVAVKSLKTGIELRDSHLHKRLLPEKHPTILGKVQVAGSSLKGILKVKGITKKFSGTCDTKSSKAICEFKLNLKDFKIQDINYMGVGVEDEVSIVAEVPIK